MTKKLLNLVKIDSSSGKRTIFCFCGRTKECRLLFKRSRDWIRAAKKATNPEMERRSELSPTKSESQKVWRENEPLQKWIPRVGVPHKYQRMGLTVQK